MHPETAFDSLSSSKEERVGERRPSLPIRDRNVDRAIFFRPAELPTLATPHSPHSPLDTHRAVSLNSVAARDMLIRYLRNLNSGRLILWCYFIWYLVVLVRYFDATLSLWLTSLGLSAIIGFALYISTVTAGASRVKLEFWQMFRLFLMPFCVSSFAALVKGKGFILIFSPNLKEIAAAAGLCLALCIIVTVLKRHGRLKG